MTVYEVVHRVLEVLEARDARLDELRRSIPPDL